MFITAEPHNEPLVGVQQEPNRAVLQCLVEPELPSVLVVQCQQLTMEKRVGFVRLTHCLGSVAQACCCQQATTIGSHTMTRSVRGTQMGSHGGAGCLSKPSLRGLLKRYINRNVEPKVQRGHVQRYQMEGISSWG